jgi:hypothetical protein
MVLDEPPFQIQRCDVGTFSIPFKIYWVDFMKDYLLEESRDLVYKLQYDQEL